MSAVQTWGATLVGLATIPFIIHPIDHAVDYVLDNSLRTLYTKADATKEVGSESTRPSNSIIPCCTGKRSDSCTAELCRLDHLLMRAGGALSAHWSDVVGRLDLTGDGVAETTAYDTVGDGKADALDTTGDGRIDTKLRPATKL